MILYSSYIEYDIFSVVWDLTFHEIFHSVKATYYLLFIAPYIYIHPYLLIQMK